MLFNKTQLSKRRQDLTRGTREQRTKGVVRGLPSASPVRGQAVSPCPPDHHGESSKAPARADLMHPSMAKDRAESLVFLLSTLGKGLDPMNVPRNSSPLENVSLTSISS